MITAQSKPALSITYGFRTRCRGELPPAGARRRSLFVSLWGGNGRVLGVTACLALTAWAIHFEHLNDPCTSSSLFVLCRTVFAVRGSAGQRAARPARRADPRRRPGRRHGAAACRRASAAAAGQHRLCLHAGHAAGAAGRAMNAGFGCCWRCWRAAHCIWRCMGRAPWDAPHYPLCLALVALAYCGVYICGRLFSWGGTSMPSARCGVTPGRAGGWKR